VNRGFAAAFGVLLLAFGLSTYITTTEIRALGPRLQPQRIEVRKPMTLSSTFTCPDGTSHTVTTVQREEETPEQHLERHRLAVLAAKKALCGN
jgi:hypothetical protein